MPKYKEIIYGSGATYGEASRVAFSAEPVTATAISHSSVELTWAKPLNTSLASYVGFRVVRNQDAFPENEEDGVILYEFYTKTAAVVDRTMFIDGKDDAYGITNAPLVSGRFCYYRAWILLDEAGEWVRAGDAYTLLPSTHASGTGPDTVLTGWVDVNGDIVDKTIGDQQLTTTHDRLMGMIPRVYLSANKGPLDEIQEYNSDLDASGADENTLLNQFLKAFSLTFDEFLNYTEFVSPEISGKNTDPNILKLQSQQFNLSFDTNGISRSQKKLVREAMYIYRRKGTLAGLQTAIEALTGYDAVITQTNNLMLSPQDSTFFHGTGFWNAGTGCTISTTQGVFAVPTSEDLALDTDWSAKINVTSVNAAIYNGYTSPVTRGIPVTAGESYTFSYHYNYNASPGSNNPKTTPSIRWFDRNGKVISTSTGTAVNSGTQSWVVHSISATAPAKATYAGVSISFNTINANWYLDMVSFTNSSSVLAYEEPRGVDVFLSPKKTNYLLDPSFDGDLSSWDITADSSSAENLLVGGVYDGPMGARSGLKKLVVSSLSSGTTSVSSTLDILPTAGVAGTAARGSFYTFSIYAKADAEVSAILAISDAYADESTAKSVQLTTDWSRFFVTHFIPEDATATASTFDVVLSGNFAGAEIQLDCAQLEASYYPTDYFDGSLTLTGGAWLGGLTYANNSPSFYYPSVNTKLTRLANEIEKFIPLNTAYTVSMYQNDGSMVPPKGIS